MGDILGLLKVQVFLGADMESITNKSNQLQLQLLWNFMILITITITFF